MEKGTTKTESKNINVIMASWTEEESGATRQEPICALYEWGPEHLDFYTHLFAKAHTGETDTDLVTMDFSEKEIQDHKENIRLWLEGKAEHFDWHGFRYSRMNMPLLVNSLSDQKSAPLTEAGYVYLRYAEDFRTPTGPAYTSPDAETSPYCAWVHFITPQSYDSVFIYDSPIKRHDGKMIMTDQDGNQIGGEIQGVIDYYGYVVVTDGRKCGMIHRSGRLLLPMEYDGISEVCNGFATIRKDGKHGFFCTDDWTVCEPVYDDIDSIDMSEYVRVRKGDRWGYVHQGDMKFYAEDDEESWPEDEWFYCGAD